MALPPGSHLCPAHLHPHCELVLTRVLGTVAYYTGDGLCVSLARL